MFFEITENNIHLAVDKLNDGQLVLYALNAGEFTNKGSEFSNVHYLLANVKLSGFGNYGCHMAKYIDSSLQQEHKVVYKQHTSIRNNYGLRVEFVQESDEIEITSIFQFYSNIQAVSCSCKVKNISSRKLQLEAAASLMLNSVVPASSLDSDFVDLTVLRSGWSAEFQPDRRTLSQWGIKGFNASGLLMHRMAVSNCGSFSCKEFHPVGMLNDRKNNCGIAWQIESAGSWYYELSESHGKHIYLYCSGGNYREHQELHELAPQDEFSSCECSVVPFGNDENTAWQELNKLRRCKHLYGLSASPVYFNDYMTIWADPTTAKVLPLIEKASQLGAEVYFIDAGWYGKGFWWNTVGEWNEEPSRFPNGIKELSDAIHKHNMRAGLWVEIERMGTCCRFAQEWPDECFFCRNGQRVIDNESYMLDFRHPIVRKHASEIFEKIHRDWQFDMIKIDNNVELAPGTTVNAATPGYGLAEHRKAYFEWLDKFMQEHKDFEIENCASGGMRNTMPFISRARVCSVSDNSNVLEHTRIVLNAHCGIPSEQSGVWTAQRQNSSIEQLSAILSAALLAAPTLSGDILELPEEQLQMIKEAMDVFKSDLREFLCNAQPYYPCGLLKREDTVFCCGMISDNRLVLGLWNFADEPKKVSAIIPEKFTNANVSVVFPVSAKNCAPQISQGKAEMDIPAKSGVLLSFDINR